MPQPSLSAKCYHYVTCHLGKFYARKQTCVLRSFVEGNEIFIDETTVDVIENALNIHLTLNNTQALIAFSLQENKLQQWSVP